MGMEFESGGSSGGGRHPALEQSVVSVSFTDNTSSEEADATNDDSDDALRQLLDGVAGDMTVDEERIYAEMLAKALDESSVGDLDNGGSDGKDRALDTDNELFRSLA